MDNKEFKLNLDDETILEEFCNNIAAAKLIADEIGLNPSYEKIVGIADELGISLDEVQGYMRLYKYMSQEMIL